jgi:hypothetical protein
VRLSSLAWVQERFSRNLYAPQGSGPSVGVRVQADLRLGRGALQLDGSHERGEEGWRATSGTVLARVFF